MTENERALAIIAAYTGRLCCPFDDLQTYLEGKGITPYTHNMQQIRELTKEDFESVLAQ